MGLTALGGALLGVLETGVGTRVGGGGGGGGDGLGEVLGGGGVGR
ncbi:hypothetical protein [Nonomuraea africana]